MTARAKQRKCVELSRVLADDPKPITGNSACEKPAGKVTVSPLRLMANGPTNRNRGAV